MATREPPAQRRPEHHLRDARPIPRAARWADRRLGTAKILRKALDKIFPDHWSFMLGEIALYAFVVLLGTGVFLTFFFKASPDTVTYAGSYHPLDGVTMSKAYESAIRLSFDVRAGLVMRQAHHWAALVFLAAITAHLFRVWFTGAYRRPREINWIVGLTLMLLALANGFLGYSLLDDQLSGSGLRIVYAVVLSIPLVGTWLTSLVFGGEFPGPDLLERFYVLHILIVPAVLVVLLTAHMAILVYHKHTQYPGPGRRDDNVVGERLWPTYMAKAGAFLFLTAAVVFLLGGVAQINPIWIFGPFRPGGVSAATQPDWYMGWLDGALRIMPGWEFRAFGYEIPNPFFPAVLMPGVLFTALYAAPFIEARFTGDHAEHHLLDRPRDRPVRTAIGVAALAFYLVLFMAASSDVVSARLGLSVNTVFWIFRISIFAVPLVSAFIANRLCLELQRRDGTTPARRRRPRRDQPSGDEHGPAPAAAEPQTVAD
jgi:ubiquinol-cytochrome c reductase cytochrome b subunit